MSVTLPTASAEEYGRKSHESTSIGLLKDFWHPSIGPKDGVSRVNREHDGAMGSAVIDAAGLQELVATLIDRGYRVVGPTLSDNAIVLTELTSAEELPRGWGVDVGPGHYRLRRRNDSALFGHSAGPQSWKQFLHPQRQRLWSSDAPPPEDIARYAFIGVRACDLAAIGILDGVLGRSAHPDQGFVNRLAGIFVVAVNCTEPGGLCFCASMNTGPAVGPGYDLALTERISGDEC